MFFFKKKKKEVQPAEGEESAEGEGQKKAEDNSSSSGNASLGQLTADLDKLKAQFSTFYELQKAATERFTRINEQIGELRSMLIERDKDSKYLEAKAQQAIDLVKTVQPDKLMVELRKQDGKMEALRANIESNESILGNTTSELKDIRNKMSVFKGMEQVVKLNEEVKAELMEIRKINAIVERHADKVETIFSEMQKRFSNFDKINSTVEELDKAFKQIASDFDAIKVKNTTLASKKEVENILNRFDAFEKHASNVLTLLNSRFESMKKNLYKDFNKKFERADRMLTGFETLVLKTPDLDKYFNLIDEQAKKAAMKQAEVEKIKEPGEAGAEEAAGATEKKGLLSSILEKFKKK